MDPCIENVDRLGLWFPPLEASPEGEDLPIMRPAGVWLAGRFDLPSSGGRIGPADPMSLRSRVTLGTCLLHRGARLSGCSAKLESG